MLTLTSRRFGEKDKKELNDSYNRYTGHSRTIEQFEWEWLNTPEGWGSIWLLEEIDTGRIVGHHGLIPINFTYFGNSVLTGKTENTHIHPPYAGKGLYYPFEVKFLEEASHRFGLLYTTQGAGAPGAVRLKLGYVCVGTYLTYMKIIQRSYSDKRLVKAINRKIHNEFIAALLITSIKVGNLILMPLFCSRRVLDEAITLQRATSIDEVAEELDRFWERNREKFGITVDRNSRYLKWRVFDNPNVTYEFFLALRQHNIVGYVITQSSEEADNRLGTIVDLIADGNNQEIFDTILNAIVSTFKENGIQGVQFPTLLSDNFLNKALKRNGFKSFSMLRKIVKKSFGIKQQESLLLAKVLDNNLDAARVSDSACWYFTSILTEGVR